jgi:putative oxidoreductase
MSIFEASRSPWTARMQSILRIVSGLVFVTAGTSKMFGFPPFPADVPTMPSTPMWEVQVAAYLEVYLGGLFALGFLTRPIALILAGEMAVAYFQVHYQLSFWPTTNWGTPPVLHCFIFLYFVFAGAGPWSIDAMIARSKGGSAT